MPRADELQGQRVLVVDDNATARQILTDMIGNFGMRADVARDGREALQKVQAAQQAGQPYNLMLLDWRMPVMDGVETARQLQTELAINAPTIIMVTAFGRDEAMSSTQLAQLSVNSVLAKPVTQSTLFEAIGEALGQLGEEQSFSQPQPQAYSPDMAALEGVRLLLVEDNALNQELALGLLQSAGVEVVLANNGQEALDVLNTGKIFDGY
jgi:CheY-like chemotaxis protein